jgi:hypothetical protein
MLACPTHLSRLRRRRRLCSWLRRSSSGTCCRRGLLRLQDAQLTFNGHQPIFQITNLLFQRGSVRARRSSSLLRLRQCRQQ